MNAGTDATILPMEGSVNDTATTKKQPSSTKSINRTSIVSERTSKPLTKESKIDSLKSRDSTNNILHKLIQEFDKEEQIALQSILANIIKEFEQSELERAQIRREWEKQGIARCKQALLREQKVLGEHQKAQKECGNYDIFLPEEIIEREKSLQSYYQSQAELLVELDEQHSIERKIETEEFRRRLLHARKQIHNLRKLARQSLNDGKG
jgi:hypothetical protein